MVMIGWKPVIQYLLWPAERELPDTNILIHPQKKNSEIICSPEVTIF